MKRAAVQNEKAQAKRRRILENAPERRIYLQKQWDSKKNTEFKPFDSYSNGSTQKVWWLCPKSNCDHPHSWKAPIGERMRGTECPYCNNKKVCVCTSICTTNPEIVALWDYEKNGDLKPENCSHHSAKKAWFICKKAKCDHHQWRTEIYQVVRSLCPFCSTGNTYTRRRFCPCMSLASLNPEVAKEWHPTKNGPLTPDKVFCKSGKKVWWKCQNHKSCDSHEWQAYISFRSKTGCPFCAPYGKACPCNNLYKSSSDELKAEWHKENKPMTSYRDQSNERVKWSCSRDPSHPDWEAVILDRTRGTGNCKKCFEHISRGEKRIGEALTKVFPETAIRHDKILPAALPSFQDNQKLRFDYLISIQDRYCAVEYDGEQHFKACLYWASNGRQRDRIKNIYAMSNKIHLLRISYSAKQTYDPIVLEFFTAVREASPEETVLHLIGKEYDTEYRATMFQDLTSVKLLALN